MPNDDTLIHPEQPRFLLSVWLWAVVLFVFFGAIVAIAFGAMHRGSTYEEDRAKMRSEKLKTAREEWNKTLTTYGWVDKGKGVAHIPIDRAMELTLAGLQATKPAPAGPIATPEPAAVPVAAAGAQQPGATAAPKSHSEVPPASPTATPVQQSPGTPLPTPGKP